MLAFIIPVLHPARCRSYERVLHLLRRTLHSINRSSDPNYVAVVVSQTRPSWADTLSNVEFVQVDFPPPNPPSSRQEEHAWTYRDKGCRIVVGLRHAARFEPSHIMFTDADDLVSRRLVAFVRTQPDAPGWYLAQGYVYSDRFKLIEPRDDFWSYCGTSHIVRRDLFPIPEFTSATPSKEDIVSALDPRYLERVLGDHFNVRRYCDERSLPLAQLPFPGAIWRADTGQNSSRAWWRQRRFGPIWGHSPTEEEIEEFSLEQETRTATETGWLIAWRVRATVGGLVRRRPRVA